ncbi:MAG: hypothetical protein EOO96_31550 [Pedobacter sp.]|nr:MAG: hypothetical protein EOO96_31550 [Pedobacter sp.]
MLNKKTTSNAQNAGITTSTAYLVDLPVNENLFNEHIASATAKEKVEIQQIKISYPKNGLYGLL